MDCNRREVFKLFFLLFSFFFFLFLWFVTFFLFYLCYFWEVYDIYISYIPSALLTKVIEWMNFFPLRPCAFTSHVANNKTNKYVVLNRIIKSPYL